MLERQGQEGDVLQGDSDLPVSSQGAGTCCFQMRLVGILGRSPRMGGQGKNILEGGHFLSQRRDTGRQHPVLKLRKGTSAESQDPQGKTAHGLPPVYPWVELVCSRSEPQKKAEKGTSLSLEAQ